MHALPNHWGDVRGLSTIQSILIVSAKKDRIGKLSVWWGGGVALENIFKHRNYWSGLIGPFDLLRMAWTQKSGWLFISLNKFDLYRNSGVLAGVVQHVFRHSSKPLLHRYILFFDFLMTTN
jgi:hypothetical protein